MRNISLKTMYFMLFMSQLCHSEVVQKDSLEIQIYNREIKRDSNIFFQFCCYKDKNIKVTDTAKNADLLPGESFVQTLFVTPGTSFYFQGENVIEGKSFQQLQYTCGPQDVNGCQVQLMGYAMKNLSSLGVRLFCKDRERGLVNTIGVEDAKIEMSLMSGSIHINGTGKKVSCDGDNTDEKKGNKINRKKDTGH